MLRTLSQIPKRFFSLSTPLLSTVTETLPTQVTTQPDLQTLQNENLKFPINESDLEQYQDIKNYYWQRTTLDAFISSFKTGQLLGLIQIPTSLFNLETREDILARCLKYEEAWNAQGTESTKQLGQVRGSSSKQFPQKKRGKARVGSLRAPQFVGGYNVHGPRPHSKTIDIQKKVYELGLLTALSTKFKQGQVLFVDQYESHSKQELKSKLEALSLQKHKILFLHGDKVNVPFATAVDQFTNKIGEEKELMYLAVDWISCKILLEHQYVVLDVNALECLEQIYQ